MHTNNHLPRDSKPSEFTQLDQILTDISAMFERLESSNKELDRINEILKSRDNLRDDRKTSFAAFKKIFNILELAMLSLYNENLDLKTYINKHFRISLLNILSVSLNLYISESNVNFKERGLAVIASSLMTLIALNDVKAIYKNGPEEVGTLFKYASLFLNSLYIGLGLKRSNVNKLAVFTCYIYPIH